MTSEELRKLAEKSCLEHVGHISAEYVWGYIRACKELKDLICQEILKEVTS